ncbi:carbohydrate ABC transporter permease [Paenibacillus cymbidii]|uniref:carbohydrate ABC transporter permease n=1 Tax=Paenibacillus cymbidii TaxID=1639034 RepID=UPI001080617D|nr:carbohydrate ABC transporter permease [Paenibacillus cymbidii]
MTIMTWGERVFQWLLIAGIMLLCVCMIYPFLHELSISLSSHKEALRPGVHLYPRELSSEAYRQVFQSGNLWTAMYNSVFRTVVGTLLMLLIMTTAAYALSKTYLPHRRLYTLYIVITMFFSGGLLPTYLLVKGLGLFDTRWSLIVPVLMNTYWMIIMRNFFMSFSVEIEESAKMDGANDIRILASIIMPLSKPILATIGLFCAVFHWNAWFDALIYTQDKSLTILQILLRRLIITGDNLDIQSMMASAQAPPPESIKAAILMVVTAPILLVYPFLQKYFTKGILVGSVKG